MVRLGAAVNRRTQIHVYVTGPPATVGPISLLVPFLLHSSFEPPRYCMAYTFVVSTKYRIHTIEPDAPVFVLSPRKTKSPGELPLVSDAQQSGVEEPKTWITSERTRATITAWSVSTSAYLRPTTHRASPDTRLFHRLFSRFEAFP